MSISIPANDNEPVDDLLEVFIAVFAKHTRLCGNLLTKQTSNPANLERGDNKVIATSDTPLLRDSPKNRWPLS
jgi:hypothetical protein